MTLWASPHSPNTLELSSTSPLFMIPTESREVSDPIEVMPDSLSLSLSSPSGDSRNLALHAKRPDFLMLATN